MVSKPDRLSNRVTAQPQVTLEEARTAQSFPTTRTISHVEFCDEMITLSRRWLVDYMHGHVAEGSESWPLQRTREEWREDFFTWLERF